MRPENIYKRGSFGKWIFIGIAFSIVLSGTACRKYVDIKKSSSQTFLETPEECQLLLDNYDNMNTNYSSDGEASADDYYLTDGGFLLSALTQTDRDLYTWSPSAIRPGAQPHWERPYKATFYANLVMESLDRIKEGTADQTAVNTVRGSALFFRAFAFWQLAQLYAKPYNSVSADGDPGIPLRLTSDINDKSVRGSVAQTYAQIVTDLKEAIGLLPATSKVVTRPNKAAGYAMLARVFLSMGDYPNALANSSAALQLKSDLIDFNTLSKTSNTPFSPRFNKEVIFHSLMAADPALNPVLSGTNVARIDDGLYASYSANDLRKTIFFKANTVSVSLQDAAFPTDPTKKKTVTVADGTYRFSGNYEPVTTSAFFNGLAVDELLITRAECYARANNVAAALSDLNSLLVTRWNTNGGATPYQAASATSADDALGKILVERRKELLMRGLRWTDLRRLNTDPRFKKDLVRQTKNITFSGTSASPVRTETVSATYTLPANDLRYTLLIPQQVIDNGGIAQNIR